MSRLEIAVPGLSRKVKALNVCAREKTDYFRALRHTALLFLCVALCLAALFSAGPPRVARAQEGTGSERRVAVVPSAAQIPHADQNWLVAVGVNSFDEERVNSLLYCKSDAEAILAFFTRSGLVPEARAYLLATGQTSPKSRPTRLNVLGSIQYAAKEATEDSTILIFLAGHGFVDEQGASYFFPEDGRLSLLKDTAVPIQRVNEMLKESRARRKVLFVDACRSNPTRESRGAESQKTVTFLEALKSAAGQVTLAACDEGQTSYEDPSSGHGVFTAHLLKGLSGEAEPDKSGIIDVSALQKYLARAVPDWANKNLKPVQNPWMWGAMSSPIPLAVVRGPGVPPVPTKPLGSVPDAPDAVNLGGGIELSVVFIKGGTFQMGSPASETDRYEDEGVHSVGVGDFWIGRYEVTQEQYERIMGNNPSCFKEAKNPVEQVSWNDARNFCLELSKKSGKNFTLPTEAQWEYACRAETATPFCFGNMISTNQANYDGNNAYQSGAKGVYREKTLPVSSLEANAWGIYNMHGNVAEWCLSLYKPYPYRDAGGRNEHSATGDRVLRGGSWLSNPCNCRSAKRDRLAPTGTKDNLGFRVVMLPSSR